ncbi:MAG: N-acetyltransferase family protein [Alphaproteobacteria bacterium]|nr:N-acetyltransferase family protein [Alphaproteobacteria bacterium]
MRIRVATPEDSAAIAAIYAPYVEGSAVSFELEAPGPETIRERMRQAADLYPWLAAEDEDGIVVGYAYASAFRARAAYRWAIESSVYVRSDAHGRGIGSALYRPLLAILEAQGFTQAIAAIAMPNVGSIRIHERFGFVHAGTYAQAGYKLGAWWDVGLWQRALATPADPPAEPRPWREVAVGVM